MNRLLSVCLFISFLCFNINAIAESKSTKDGTGEVYKDGLQDIGGGFKKVGLATGRFFDHALDKVRLGIKGTFNSDGSQTGNLKKDKAFEEDLSEPNQNTHKQSDNDNLNNQDLIGNE